MDKDNIKDSKTIIRAMITPYVEEPEDNVDLSEFTCIAVPTDNKQLRYSTTNKEYFYQVLRTAKENIVTSRLDSGLPLFDNHPEPEDAGAMCILGISTTYEFIPDGLQLTTKLGARADNILRSDIKNQVVKTVSIEGDIHEYEIERKVGEIPTYYATLWEPTSLSLAPIPQDIGSQMEVRRAIQKQIEKPETGKSFFKSLTNKF